MKRSLSESDNDDVFDDQLKSGSPSQSCQITDRKKRRGVIEKRRRDRINASLSELRRLVPSAFEKQGSSKLEKAEILQMTVDHLKFLHSKGINGYNYPDPHALALDYRAVGFRECAAEVARYLVTVEGIDLQDPMRLRLLSHLQCYSAQREAAAKASYQNSSWNSMPSHSAINSINPQYNSGSMSSVPAMLPPHSTQTEHTLSSHSGHSGLSSVAFTTEPRLNQSDNSSSLPSHMRLPTATNMSGSSQMSSMNTSNQQSSSNFIPSLPHQLHSQFPMSLNVNSVMSQNNSNSYNNQMSGVKPYRPWGGEIAY
ncbi:hypothetical protein CHS0354_024988 [Potamilus streckersoni]|uniref:Hairy/enhancer-of-split related with YRPW motif protein n=1 Tax=Potamilus streckersoni TaxID=2493646 RepID=A0AAE0T2Y5_9BIVA|nr:hypothetical protein CHS0354_024988 [Potamilus streckersoni]